MSSLCLVLGLGGSNGHVRMRMRASSITLGIWGCDISLSMTTPRMSSVSSRRPPALPCTEMRSKRVSWCSRSDTASTASTAIWAILRLCTLMILDDSVVWAVSTRKDFSSALNSTWVAIVLKCSTATSAACSKPSAMRTGCSPRSRSFSASLSSAPASTTTPVVPSPTSLSWDCDRSTRSLPIWWSTSMRCRMVAPSFVMVTSPSEDTSILSMPLGPRDDRSVLVTDWAARRLAFIASMPRSLALACCSRSTMKGRPYSSVKYPAGCAMVALGCGP
mmetsp:Transcript_15867/g.53855  ORF Transcript_15867/g.53855 Transcript_15867/m.53855 type:complete len:276 (-) Transcript_15867:63-890(-)